MFYTADHFIKDKNLRKALNKNLGLFPINFVKPTPEEYLKKILRREKNISFNFSNYNISSLEGLLEIEWNKTSRDMKIIMNFSDNNFSSIDVIESLCKMRNFHIILNNISLSDYDKYKLTLIQNYNKNSIIEFDNLCPIEDKAFLRELNYIKKNHEKFLYISNSHFNSLKKLFSSEETEEALRKKITLNDIYFMNFSNKKIQNLKGIENLDNLREFNLSNNFLFNYENEKIILNSNIKSINLSNNPYLSELPNFTNCIDLEKLVIDNTRFYKSEQIIGLKKLKKINVENTEITDNTFINKVLRNNNLIDANFSGIPNSEILELNRIELNGSLNRLILKNISPISVSIDFDNFYLENLRELNFSGNYLSNSILDLSATNIQNLILSNMSSLTKIILPPTIKVFVANKNDITNFSDVITTGNSNLKLVSLRDCNISDIREDELFRLNKNCIYDIRNNPLKKSVQKMLEKNLDGYKILFTKDKLFNISNKKIKLR